MDQTQTPSEHPKLDALIAGYLEAVERGEAPDRNPIVAENPDIAAELQAFFDDLDRVERAAASPSDGPAPHKPDAAHASTVIRPNNEPTPGVIIAGRYKLLENIGEGGMGSVWVAEQLKPVKRKVAIKLIKPGMDSKQVLARFEAERQALAVMDHPNIAKVFDGGLTEQGRPYFVMEYVKGVPFTDYCDRARLPLKDRLTLFIAVCSAVQHAHQKGIVHRDLKPSNILICLYDGHPVPKVIDFGLAKAMHQPLTEQSIFTGHGVMVGTPLYMSPEQAESNNLDIDTRTDIYSLGVVLYELLTGSTPLERQQLQKAAFDEVLRLIKEVEPPRPSLRLSGSESLASIAAQRSIDPKQLSRSLAGDLDWIAMKALDKERSRRYETANGLARDIERFLNEEPVEACPPSTAYRLKKFVQKHRGQVIAAGVVLTTLLLGIIGTTWGLFQAEAANEKTKQALREVTTERDAKEAERKKAEAAQQSETEQRTRAERQLLSGILRPIGFGNIPETAELKALADWSALNDSRLQIMGLELALQDPDSALRIARRAERVIQASVGLSSKRHSKAVELMSAKQRDMNADPRIRVAACWLALELGSADLPAFEEGIEYLSNTYAYQYHDFSVFMTFAIGRTSHLQEIRIARGADALIDVLEATSNDTLAREAVDCLERLAQRLSNDQAARGWDALLRVLQKTTDTSLSNRALRCQISLAPRLSSEQFTRRADKLISLLETPSDDAVLRMARDSLPGLAPRLSTEQLTRLWYALIKLQKTSTDGIILHMSGSSLPALAPRLSSEQLTPLVNSLIDMFEKSKGDDITWHEIAILEELVPMLSDDLVTRGGDVLIELLKNSSDSNLTEGIWECLAAMAPRLRAEQVAREWETLVDVLVRSTDDNLSQTVGDGLTSLAPILNSEQVLHGWDTLLILLRTSKKHGHIRAAGSALSSLAPRLNDEQSITGGNVLIDVLESSSNDALTHEAGECMVILAPRLSATQLTRAGIAVTRMLKNPTNEDSVDLAGDCFVALSEWLTNEQVTFGVEVLAGTLKTTTSSFLTREIVENLVTLSPRFTSEQVILAWDALAHVTENSADDSYIWIAGNCLVELTPRLNEGHAACKWGELLALVQKSSNATVIEVAERCLEALAPRMSVEQVDQARNSLINIINKPMSNEVLRPTIACLLSLAPRLSDDEAKLCKDALTVTMDHQEDHDDISELAELFCSLRTYMSVQERQSVAMWLVEKVTPDTMLAIDSPNRFLKEILEDISTRELISFQAAARILDDVGSASLFKSSDGWGSMADPVAHRSISFELCLESIFTPKVIAKMSSHPACVGTLRDSVLQRFEELLFHDGQNVFLNLKDGDDDKKDEEREMSPGPDSDQSAEGVGVTAPERRFHNLHDAAAWIEQNWPDFDLETNHPMTWRAGN